MDVEEIVEQLTIEDMPSYDMKMVAKYMNIETAVEMMQKMGGMSIYVPKNPFPLIVERLLRATRNPDFKELAINCNVTERYVRKIWQKINAGDLRQNDLFEPKEGTSAGTHSVKEES